MLSDQLRISATFTRYFLEGEIDARTAARELAAIPGFTLDGHYYWLGPMEGLEEKFADLRAELAAIETVEEGNRREEIDVLSCHLAHEDSVEG